MITSHAWCAQLTCNAQPCSNFEFTFQMKGFSEHLEALFLYSTVLNISMLGLKLPDVIDVIWIELE